MKSIQWRRSLIIWATILLIIISSSNANNSITDEEAAALAAANDQHEHPDPNEENYSGMVYIGRIDDDGKRTGFHVDGTHVDNGVKYIYGTGFDETHKEIEEQDLHHYNDEHYGPDSEHDIADRAHGKTREQVMHEKRAGKIDLSKGPKPFGWFEEHPLDGGMVPPKVVRVDPFFLGTFSSSCLYARFDRSVRNVQRCP